MHAHLVGRVEEELHLDSGSTPRVELGLSTPQHIHLVRGGLSFILLLLIHPITTSKH